MHKNQYYVIAFDNNQVTEEDLLKKFNIDWEKMIERNINSKAKKIFEALKWNLPNNTNQLQLF